MSIYDRTQGATGHEFTLIDSYATIDQFNAFISFDGRQLALSGLTPTLSRKTQVIKPFDDACIVKDYHWWAEENFPAEHPTASLKNSVWGNTADPDRDGLSNLEEAFFAEDPNEVTPTPFSISELQPGKSLLMFTQDIGQVGISGTLQASSNLTNWPDIFSLRESNRVGVDLGGDRFQWSLELDHPVNTPDYFYRIRVESE